MIFFTLLYIQSALCITGYDVYANVSSQSGFLLYFEGDNAVGKISYGYPALMTQDHFVVSPSNCQSGCNLMMTDSNENLLQARYLQDDTFELYNTNGNIDTTLLWNLTEDGICTPYYNGAFWVAAMGLYYNPYFISGEGYQKPLFPYVQSMPNGSSDDDPVVYLSTDSNEGNYPVQFYYPEGYSLCN